MYPISWEVYFKPGASPHDPPSADAFARREETTGCHQRTTTEMLWLCPESPRVLRDYVPIIRTPRKLLIHFGTRLEVAYLDATMPLLKTLRVLFPVHMKINLGPQSGKCPGFRMRLQMMPSHANTNGLSWLVTICCIYQDPSVLSYLSRHIGICGNLYFKLDGL